MNELVEKSNVTASVVPDISLMKKMASISGTISSRILELVDNSIDAIIPGHQLKVDITIHKKGKNQYIKINDNGSGMTEDVSKNYFKLGKSNKEGSDKIGKFGLGAKVAILGLGDSCTIKTSPVDKPYKIHMDFDINKFSKWEIQYNKLDDDIKNHGTEVIINDITVRLGDVDKLSERLSEQLSKTYKHFIKSKKVKIKINGNEIKPHSVDLIDDLYEEFDFEINGKRVYGWAGATITAGTNWKFGFDLINNGRIIKSNDFLSRQAHSSLSRLVGEIHLDGFPTDIHKTDFMRDNDDFQEMQDFLINDVLSELLTKIAKLTNKDVFSKYKKNVNEISQVFNKVINLKDFLDALSFDEDSFKVNKPTTKEEHVAFTVIDDTISDPQEENEDEEKEKENEENEEENKKENEPKPKPRLGFFIEEPVLLSLGEDQDAKKWSITNKKDGTYLNVEINMDHPTFIKEDEVEISIKNSIMDSIAEFVVKEEKKNQTFFEDEIDRLITIKDLLVRYSANYI